VRDNKQLWGEQYNRKSPTRWLSSRRFRVRYPSVFVPGLAAKSQSQLQKRDTNNPSLSGVYERPGLLEQADCGKREESHGAVSAGRGQGPELRFGYVGLADCYVTLIEYAGASTSDNIPKSIALAERALQLDPSLGEAHASLGWCYGAGLWQWGKRGERVQTSNRAKSELSTAHQWYSLLLRDLGRFKESEFEITRAQELDPLSLIIGQKRRAGLCP
jgi:tetratricopeptide (TPR) repeat protein